MFLKFRLNKFHPYLFFRFVYTNSLYFRSIKYITEKTEYIKQEIRYTYLIFTDALSVLLNASEPSADIKTSPHILEIKKKYLEFLQIANNEDRIKFHWIPSRRAISANKQADGVAKSMCSSSSPESILVSFNRLLRRF